MSVLIVTTFFLNVCAKEDTVSSIVNKINVNFFIPCFKNKYNYTYICSMKRTITLLLLFAFTSLKSQSFTVGLFEDGTVIAASDNVNTTTEYSLIGYYVGAQVSTKWISPIVYTSPNPYLNRIGVNIGLFQNGINVGVGGKLNVLPTSEWEIKPEVILRVHPIKLLRQKNRSVDVSLMYCIGDTKSMGLGISLPFRFFGW